MERYNQLFSRLSASNEGAFVPFVTLGDPSPELSLRVIDALVEGGADALELGIPFSDPLADGPTIQNATLRAFAAGTTTSQCFEMLATIRRKYPDLPIGLLMYANLVFTNGVMRSMHAVPKPVSIRFWSPMCRLKSRRRSARRRCVTAWPLSLSVHPMPAIRCCVRSRRTAGATPTCCRVPG